MKKLSPLVIPLIMLFAAGCHSVSTPLDNNGADTVGLMLNSDSHAAEDLAVDNATFEQQLSPYGTWVDHSGYGRVWIPREGRRFRPYCSHGRWVYSDAGWTWNSDYRWGWAPFHYGRWAYDNGDGWFWVPGNEWAPAWVTWGNYKGYYGWAPLAPGISMDIVLARRWAPPADYWNFVPEREFARQRYYSNVVNTYSDPQAADYMSSRVNYIASRPPRTFYNSGAGYAYNAGPTAYEVERSTRQRITPLALRENTSPEERISNRQMNIYSPALGRRYGQPAGNNFAASPLRNQAPAPQAPGNGWHVSRQPAAVPQSGNQAFHEQTRNNPPVAFRRNNGNPGPAYNYRTPTQYMKQDQHAAYHPQATPNPGRSNNHWGTVPPAASSTQWHTAPQASAPQRAFVAPHNRPAPAPGNHWTPPALQNHASAPPPPAQSRQWNHPQEPHQWQQAPPQKQWGTPPQQHQWQQHQWQQAPQQHAQQPAWSNHPQAPAEHWQQQQPAHPAQWKAPEQPHGNQDWHQGKNKH